MALLEFTVATAAIMTIIKQPPLVFPRGVAPSGAAPVTIIYQGYKPELTAVFLQVPVQETFILVGQVPADSVLS